MSRLILEILWVVTTPWYWAMRTAARADGQAVDEPLSMYNHDVQPWLNLWARLAHGRTEVVITLPPRRIEPTPPPAP